LGLVHAVLAFGSKVLHAAGEKAYSASFFSFFTHFLLFFWREQRVGMAREMYDALTDVLHEHRVFVLDAGPELMEEAVRRALAKRPGEFGPDVIERAVRHAVLERTPPASPRLTR
jgi:hypothetical protein